MGGLLHCSLILWYLLLAVWCLPMTVKSVYAARGYVCSSVPNPYCTLFWQGMWSQLAGKCCQFWAPFIWTLRSTRTPKSLILADGRYTHAWTVLFDRFDRSQYSLATDAMSSLFICIAGAGPDVVRQEVCAVRRRTPALPRLGAGQSGGCLLPAPPRAPVQLEVGRRGRPDGAPVRGVQQGPAHRDMVPPAVWYGPLVRRAALASMHPAIDRSRSRSWGRRTTETLDSSATVKKRGVVHTTTGN